MKKGKETGGNLDVGKEGQNGTNSEGKKKLLFDCIKIKDLCPLKYHLGNVTDERLVKNM